MEFVWTIHLRRVPWNHRNYTACLFLQVGELQLKPAAFNSSLACVNLVFESGIIQWAQQEAFIWLSLCFPASVECANIREDIRSSSLFCHSCVRGRTESPPGDAATDLSHLYFILTHQLGKKLVVRPVTSKQEGSDSWSMADGSSWLILSLPRGGAPGWGLKRNLLAQQEPRGSISCPSAEALTSHPLNLDPDFESSSPVHC